jgi:RNA ligase
MGSQNRIVVDYGDYEGLVLLGTFDKNGKEYDVEMWSQWGFDVVKKYDGINDYKQLKGRIENNQEGFVVKFTNGERIKIKGEEYLRLHKIMTNLSTTAVWEVLSNGDNIENLLKDVPDEFYKKIMTYERDLKYGFFQISERAGKLHDGFRYEKYGDIDSEPTKKEFADFVLKQDKVLQPVMFTMWDKKPYDHIIWKLLKPEFRKL